MLAWRRGFSGRVIARGRLGGAGAATTVPLVVAGFWIQAQKGYMASFDRLKSD
jgi:hypothetical protein